MSEINYNQMSDQELRQYFLEHKNEQSALHKLVILILMSR